MLALEYRPSLPRYLATRAVKRLGPTALHLTELDPPRLPEPDWVPLRPRLSGICGEMELLRRPRSGARALSDALLECRGRRLLGVGRIA